MHTLCGPLMQQALVGRLDKTLYIAMYTSMLWDTYCMVHLSVIYRGRAVPLVWRVINHGSAAVSYDVYTILLALRSHCEFAAVFLPGGILADRGFADTTLMRRLKQIGEPAIDSKKQDQIRQCCFLFEYQEAA